MTFAEDWALHFYLYLYIKHPISVLLPYTKSTLFMTSASKYHKHYGAYLHQCILNLEYYTGFKGTGESKHYDYVLSRAVPVEVRNCPFEHPKSVSTGL